MRKVLNIMLIFSVIIAAGLGIFVYVQYQSAKKVDTKLLQQNTALYEDPLKVKEGRVDDVKLNLIYYMSQETQDLNEMVLEILDTKSAKLSYLVFPKDTEVSVDSQMYQKLCALNAKMPQYFTLEYLKGLFSEKEWFQYGQLIIDKFIGIDSSCYTVIYGEKPTFKEYVQSVDVTLMQQDSIEEVTKEIMKTSESNLKKDEWLSYSKNYTKLTQGDIKYYKAAGEQLTECYKINMTELTTQIYHLEHGEQQQVTE